METLKGVQIFISFQETKNRISPLSLIEFSDYRHLSLYELLGIRFLGDIKLFLSVRPSDTPIIRYYLMFLSSLNNNLYIIRLLGK